MSNEEKLSKLLQIAVENGFDLDSLPSHFNEWLNNSNSAHLKDRGQTRVELINHTILVLGSITYSIDRLVSHWEVGEVSFFGAILKYVQSRKDDLVAGEFIAYINAWSSVPTSERLDWLFDTFQYLLK